MTPTSAPDTIAVPRPGLPDVERFVPDQDRRAQRRFTPARTPFGRRTLDRDPLISEAPARSSVQAREKLYRRSLISADSFAAFLSLLVAVVVVGGAGLQPAAIAVGVLFVGFHHAAGLYDRDKLVIKRSTLDEAPLLLQLGGLFALTTWLLGDRVADQQLERFQVLVLWTVVVAASLGGRLVARGIPTRLASVERCLVIGAPEIAGRIRAKMQASRLNADVVAALSATEGHNLAVLDGVDPFRALVTELGIDRVILAPVSTDSADMLELIRIAKAVGVRVSVLPRMLEVVGSSVEFDDLDGLPMLGVRRFGLSPSSRLLKRAFDLLGATVGLLAISPVLLALALAIRLDSRGPVFFRQTRVGRHGKHFRMIKFRSMDPDAEARKADLIDRNETVGLFKIAEDPRITRVGRFIRGASLDELPQLINVLRGEMSLVGPRPLVIDEDAQVEGLLRSRLHLTPGMTGPWQVLGSSRIPMAEMVKIDYLYVASWSLWSDVKLMVRTVPHMVSSGGM